MEPGCPLFLSAFPRNAANEGKLKANVAGCQASGERDTEGPGGNAF